MDEEEQKNLDILEAKKLLEDANAAADRLEEANRKTEMLQAQERIIKAQSGTTEAGQEKQEEEDKLKEETMEFWKGTDIEKAIEKHG
jgi:hypothetical protein